jgi:hypothetical protein
MSCRSPRRLAERFHDAALMRLLDVDGQHFVGLALSPSMSLTARAGARRPVRSLRGAWFRAGWSGAVRRGRRRQEHVGVGRFPRRAAPRWSAAPCCRRSRIWRLVTNLPSVPASGEVLTMEVMFSVGSSIAAAACLRVARVADGDADADLFDAGDQHDVAGFGFVAARARGPGNRNIIDLADLGAPCPSVSSPYITTTSWPAFMRPRWMRPMPMRPT